MAYLISNTDFTGLFGLPDAGDVTVQSKCDELIAENQNVILDKLLGYELRKEFLADVAGSTHAAKFTTLLNGGEYTDLDGHLNNFNGVKKMLIYFISAELIRYYSTFTNQGNGEANAKSNNAVVSDYDKYFSFYNNGVREYRNIACYVYANSTSFPKWLYMQIEYRNKSGF